MEIVSSGIVAVPSGVSSTGLYLIQEGVLHVLDGGWAQDIGLAEGGQAFVSGGGILYLCTVSSGGTATVLKGGYAQDVTVENGGLYFVSSGGTAHKSLLRSGGTQIVYEEAVAIGVTVLNGGVLDVSSGGCANAPVVSQGGALHTWSDALVDGGQIAGMVEVNANAAANSVSILDGGKLILLTGGYAHEPAIGSGGALVVSSGATAAKIKENGGYVQIEEGADVSFAPNTFSGVALNKMSATVHAGTTATETIINASGILHISSGGTANSTTVNSRGSMFVSSGGTANSTTVNSRGSMFVSSGGLADGTALLSGGIFNVSAGGIVRDTTVSLGGRFTVSSGGTANDVSLNGRITVSSGGTATGIVVSDGALWDFTVAPDTLIAGTLGGSAFEIGNGLVSGCTVNTGDTLNISSGGAADSVTVNGGVMYVESTGVLNNTTLNRGTIFVYEKAIVNNIAVSSGTLSVMDGGIADGIAVSSGGSFSLYRESLVDNVTVFSGGEIRAFNGGDLENAAVSGGLLTVASLGLANSATVNGGELQISSGGLANDVLVSSGDLHIFNGGMANSASVNSGGRVILESEGTVNHATVGAGGTLKIESGGDLNSALVQGDGRLLGYFDCANITFASGAALYFDVSAIAPGNKGALVDLTRLSDPETVPFRLLISDSQETGVYKLAAGAAGFDRTISVVNDVMELGSVSIGQSVKINGKEYTLNLNDDELTLSVSAPTAQYVYLDFDGEELVRYSNPDLKLSFDLSVAAPAFSEEQRAAIVSELTKQYNKYNIAFTLERPEGVEYSTLYFGQSAAFAKYGDFFGVAETHDGNNRNHTDNAFVLLDENYSQGQIVSVASHMLDHLLGFSCFTVDGAPSLRKYAENLTLLSGSSDWIQEDPYNKYCPIDPKDDKRCITGCTNNAASQIIYYWLEKGMLDLTLTLEDSDAYKCTTGITIDSSDAPASGHLSFAETNSLLSDFQLENIDCIAALCFAAGVVQKAQYSSTSTGAFWNKDLFVRAGFDPASVVDKYMTVINWPESSDSYVDPNTRLADRDFMVGELLQGRPVGVSLQSISHAVVVDGYDSARNMFHLNFG